MILFIENQKGERKHYLLHTEEDFEPIFEKYPRTRILAENAYSVDQAAQAISRYLSNGYNRSWIESGELNKTIKEKALALGLGIASAFSPNTSEAPKIPEQSQQITQASIKNSYKAKPFGESPEDAFLWPVMQNESSGGKNINHDSVKAGPYKGQTAMGRWGLLPSTVREILSRKSRQGELHPDFARLGKMSDSQMKSELEKNPHIELGIARSLARHVLKRQKGDLQRAAYSWLYGHNKDHASITEDMLKDSYVQKFNTLHEKNPFIHHSGKLHEMINKSEEDGFTQKLKLWQKKREEQSLSRRVTSSESIDLGRNRDKELDDLDNKPTDLRQKLKAAIDAAKKANSGNNSGNR